MEALEQHFKGGDGAPDVTAAKVNDLAAYNTQTVCGALDNLIAAAYDSAENADELIRHLNYCSTQLMVIGANVMVRE